MNMPANIPTAPANTQQVSAFIQSWMIKELAKHLDISADDIDPTATFDTYSLDSTKAVLMIANAEKMLGFELSQKLFWHYPTITALSQRLAEECSELGTNILETADPEAIAQALSEIEGLSDAEINALLGQ